MDFQNKIILKSDTFSICVFVWSWVDNAGVGYIVDDIVLI